MNDITSKGSYYVSVENIYPNELTDFLEEPDLHAQIAYDWMTKQMSKRISLPPEGVKYPIWGWVKQSERSWHDKHPRKHDMRSWITNKPEYDVCLYFFIRYTLNIA